MSTQKTLLRREFTARRDALDASLAEMLDGALCRAVMSLPEFASAATLLLYAPIGREIDVRPLFFAARDAGKAVAFPRTEPSAHRMVFYLVDSLGELAAGSYGIPEPPPDRPAELSDALCIVPALVFDRDGYRLGYGGGYYDRFLAENSVGITTAAPVRDGFLLSESLPRGVYDRRVDIIVTSKEVIRFNRE